MAEEQKNLQFKIAQLRQDKIIYAVEACALNLVCLLIFFFSNQYLSGLLRTIINMLDLLVAVGYTIFMGIGNTIRFRKILSLEKKL